MESINLSHTDRTSQAVHFTQIKKNVKFDFNVKILMVLEVDSFAKYPVSYFKS